MTHRMIVPLLLAAGALVGPLALPAVAQDAPPVAPESEEAEVAFLRAYYLEKGLRDLDAAEKAYGDVAKAHAADAQVAAKARIGRLRCLAALGRADDARALQARLETLLAKDARALAEMRRIDVSPSTSIDPGVFDLVMKALLTDTWAERVPKFGAHAVPTLARTMRSPDPDHVSRAAQSLMRIGDEEASAVLADALQDESILFPDQIVNACKTARSGVLPEHLGRALLAMPDSRMRRTLIDSAAALRGSAVLKSPLPQWLSEAVVSDAEIRDLVLRRDNPYGIRPRLALHAMASGNATARDDAVAYLEATATDEYIDHWVAAAAAPPPGILTDEVALNVLAKYLYVRRPDIQPSAALFERVAKDPAHAALAQRWRWFHDVKLPMDREVFLASLEKDGWDVSGVRWNQRNTAGIDVQKSLLSIFGPGPSADHLRRLTTTWPTKFSKTFERYAASVVDDSEVGEDQMRALVDASPGPTFRDVVFTAVVREFHERKFPEWMIDLVLTAIEESEDQRLRKFAADALNDSLKAVRIDWTPYRARLLPLIEQKELARDLIQLLVASGPAGAESLAGALRPGNPAFDQICEALVRLRQPTTADALRRILVAPANGHPTEAAERQRATQTLVKVLRDDAEPTLIEALKASDGAFAKSVFHGIGQSTQALSVPMRARVARRLLEVAPETVSPWEHGFAMLLGMVQREERDAITRVAFDSPSALARQWAAREAASSLAPGFVEPLVELLSDPVHTVQNEARRTLLKYRQIEDDSDWVKSIATRRAAAARVDELLASDAPRDRMAGIAGLVAHGGADVATRLLEVAAGDPDDAVAEEARRALMSLGRITRTTVEAAPGKNKEEK